MWDIGNVIILKGTILEMHREYAIYNCRGFLTTLTGLLLPVSTYLSPRKGGCATSCFSLHIFTSLFSLFQKSLTALHSGTKTKTMM